MKTLVSILKRSVWLEVFIRYYHVTMWILAQKDMTFKMPLAAGLIKRPVPIVKLSRV